MTQNGGKKAHLSLVDGHLQADSYVPSKEILALWQDIYSQQQELITIEDAGPAVRQRAERDLQVALDVITSLGLSPINDDTDEAKNDD